MQKNVRKDNSPVQNKSGSLKSLGICLGASTISIAKVNAEIGKSPYFPENPKVIGYSIHSHEGDLKQTLLSALEEIDIKSFDRIAATGRKFRGFVNLSSISEPEAVEYAYRYVKPPDITCPAIVSAGGETFMAYSLNSSGLISNVFTGNKCASGTGEFLLQQLRRMDVSLDEAADWAASEEPYHVSGRCSVFCKSDCTHATNKGVPKSEVIAGLCKMMADKTLELLKKTDRQNIMITGGSAQNRMMIEYLRREIPGLLVPDEAPYFEAMGAALWALENETEKFPGISGLFNTGSVQHEKLPPLRDFQEMVEFKTGGTGDIKSGDECILGLDVGSTTTKAILLRKEDNAILESIYLRTNGDPVGASRLCYRSILEKIKLKVDPSEIPIKGLGVCGSGRQIAGLHALTNGIINEIIAHAAAAVYYDPMVDTIFEIGGQDAKYTYITNGVPSDYAMNEACSAGTGSFLEESAFETLGVKMEEIAGIAMKGERPPNFNDQCAAFISSDIKNAIHEGTAHDDIVAGLVYSICMNYSNRVKGNRPVGEKVFMQGGVCYNRAIPLAMASITGKPIIVPPEPGLMGAFGAALEIKRRIERGVLEKADFDLEVLLNREVRYGKTFICGGGKEKCDRKCEIAMVELEGKKYPFGGACNRYYNLQHSINYDVEKLDIVRSRSHMIFGRYSSAGEEGGGVTPLEKGALKKAGKIGFNRSFLVNTYYPLYFTFFTQLGFEPILPDSISQKGIDHRNAAFCYPGELSHGYFYSLINREDPPEYIFLPHFKAIPASPGHSNSQVCPFIQGEAFYLKTAFKEKITELEKKGTMVLSPLIDMTEGAGSIEKSLIETASRMGIGKTKAKISFKLALAKQAKVTLEMREMGKSVLSQLEAEPDKTAVVIFGRSYNAFTKEANMGIPHKFASRGVSVIPFDFLPLEGRCVKKHMYWGMGQLLLEAAEIVKNHPQLFGTFITNFSCGPDSFIIGYFRELMGQKPSLTLELDNHTADAGLETRIEAFLDIVSAYRQLTEEKKIIPTSNHFTPAYTTLLQGIPEVITSSGEKIPITSPRVTLLFPSMGEIASESLSAAFRGAGFNAVAHPPADDAILKMGRANTSCKECLPLILTTGTLLNYINNRRRKNEIVVYFMPTASGPCRFGQYYVFMEDLIKRLKIPDVALFSLSSENSYAGLENSFHQKVWWSIVVSDVMEDIRSMILANASDTAKAMDIFKEEWESILKELERGNFSSLERQIASTTSRFRSIPTRRPPSEVPTISLVGEIFVRRDPLSRRFLTERLAEKGIAAICSPVAEWVLYSNYLVETGRSENITSLREKLKFFLKKKFMTMYEKRIKIGLSASGLVKAAPIDIRALINNADSFISPDLTGEAVLTIGSSLTEVVSHTCGVIAIGPFGCMPNRLSESILNQIMKKEEKISTDPENEKLRAILSDIEDLPFLAIESDGSPFPQLIEAKLESFCLRAERLHGKMMSGLL